MTDTAITLELTHEEIAANRRAWLAALRSGNYSQAHRALRTISGFCCLGVAEDVLDCDWEPISFDGGGATHLAFHRVDGLRTRDASLTSLTRTTMARLGLVQINPNVAFYRRHHGERTHMTGWAYASLVGLNDTYRLSLATIADVIESQGEDWDGGTDRAKLLATRWADDHREPDPRLIANFREWS